MILNCKSKFGKLVPVTYTYLVSSISIDRSSTSRKASRVAYPPRTAAHVPRGMRVVFPLYLFFFLLVLVGEKGLVRDIESVQVGGGGLLGGGCWFVLVFLGAADDVDVGRVWIVAWVWVCARSVLCLCSLRRGRWLFGGYFFGGVVVVVVHGCAVFYSWIAGFLLLSGIIREVMNSVYIVECA